MMDESTREVIDKITRGEIDINNQSLFFPLVVKGFLLNINKKLVVRGTPIPHFILHTGDDEMYLGVKGQDASIEPLEVSNEDYVYNTIPRCIVKPGSVSIPADQITNPYVPGSIDLQIDNSLYPIVAQFRRMPVKLSLSLKYYVNSYADLMTVIQQVITSLAFVQTYKIVYLGQEIICSYNTPDSQNGEWSTDLDGQTTDNKYRTCEFDVEIESNLPVFDNRTAMYAGNIISKSITNVSPAKMGEKINNKIKFE